MYNDCSCRTSERQVKEKAGVSKAARGHIFYLLAPSFSSFWHFLACSLRSPPNCNAVKEKSSGEGVREGFLWGGTPPGIGWRLRLAELFCSK